MDQKRKRKFISSFFDQYSYNEKSRFFFLFLEYLKHENYGNDQTLGCFLCGFFWSSGKSIASGFHERTVKIMVITLDYTFLMLLVEIPSVEIFV
jgi:hypothetical protein